MLPVSPDLRPTVTVSYAQTLDGRLATADGRSQWISGPESLRFTHGLRAAHDAVVVGVGTVCQDDPRLTVRLVEGRNPLRVVVDSTLRLPVASAVLADGAAAGTLLATTERAPAVRRDALSALGATVLTLPHDADGRVDLGALLAELHACQVGSAMVEGGAALITSVLRARLADRLAVCIAPKILGAGIEAVGELGIRDLSRSLTVVDTTVTAYGVDLVLEGSLIYPQYLSGASR